MGRALGHVNIAYNEPREKENSLSSYFFEYSILDGIQQMSRTSEFPKKHLEFTHSNKGKGRV